MPTSNSGFPTVSNSASPRERDPHIRITRALERTRTELAIVLTELKNARSVGLRLELVDRALRLHFLGARLGRRLAVLGEGGLLALSAIRETDVAAIVRACAAEVAPECHRRQITLELRLDVNLHTTWIDAEQLSEAVRCLIDDAMEALAEQGTLVLEARSDATGFAILVRDDRAASHDDDVSETDLALAARLAGALNGALERHSAGPVATSVTETVLRLPELRSNELDEETAPRSNAA